MHGDWLFGPCGFTVEYDKCMGTSCLLPVGLQ